MAKKDTTPAAEEHKTFSDFYAAVDFYPDVPKRPLPDVIDKPCLVIDAHIVKGFKSKFGESDFALILMKDLDSQDQFTTLCGGEVVVKKLSDALKENLLPLYGTICKPAHYFDIV